MQQVCQGRTHVVHRLALLEIEREDEMATARVEEDEAATHDGRCTPLHLVIDAISAALLLAACALLALDSSPR